MIRPFERSRSTRANARTLILGLSFLQLIAWGSLLYSFSVFLGPVEAALEMSRTQSSFAFSMALLLEGLVAFRVGRWIDAGHERALITCGSIVGGLALMGHGFIHSPFGFYLAWTAVGLAMGITLYTPVFAVVTRRFPGSYRQAIIVISFLGGLASTVFIPLTDWRLADSILGLARGLVGAGRNQPAGMRTTALLAVTRGTRPHGTHGQQGAGHSNGRIATCTVA